MFTPGEFFIFPFSKQIQFFIFDAPNMNINLHPMKKAIFLLVFATCLSFSAFPTTYYSKGSLAPNQISSWNSNRDGTSGTTPGNFTSGDIFIVQNGHVMATSSTWSVSGAGSRVWIENGGSLTAGHGITLSTVTTFQIDNGGSYVQNVESSMETGALQGIEAFGPSSNFTYNSRPTGVSAPTSPGYGNLTINTSTTSTPLAWNAGLTEVQGDLTVLSTGTGTTYQCFAVDDNITVDVGGNFSLSGTNTNFRLSSGAGKCTLNVAGELMVSGSAFLDCGATSVVAGTGTFYISAGATLLTAHTEGINGSIAISGTKTFDGGADYVFNGSAAQATGTFLPSTVNNLTIDNAAGVTLSNSDLTVNGTLLINDGKKLEIGVGKKVTAESLTNNNTGNSGLIIKSDATGNGSLIQTSGSDVHVTVERHTPAATWSVGSNGWHMLSSPVQNEPISGNWTPTGIHNDYDFFAWSESASGNNWLNQKVSGNNITSFVPGYGYMVAYEATETKMFAGALNANDIGPFGLAHTANSPYPGWHLMGNPYPCAISWFLGNWGKSNLGNHVQIWNSTAKSYKVLSDPAQGIIPAMNGFMVYANSGGGSLTIPADARLHSDSNWYKSAEEQILLTAHDLDNGGEQETIIRFSEHGQDEFNSGEDCLFIAGFAPTFCSNAGTSNLALNTLPALEQETQIPLTFVKNNSDHFSINLRQSISGAQVLLTDTKTSQTINLSQEHSYAFASVASDDPGRFVLHFSGVGMDEQTPAIRPVTVFTLNNEICISSASGQPVKGEVSVYNMMGQLVNRRPLGENSLTKFEFNGVAGYYIVKVVTASGVVAGKLFVR